MTPRELCLELNKTAKFYYNCEPFVYSLEYISVFPRDDTTARWIPPEFVIQSEAKIKEHGHKLYVSYYCYDYLDNRKYTSISVEKYLERVQYKMKINEFCDKLNKESQEKFKKPCFNVRGNNIVLAYEHILPIDYIIETDKKVKDAGFEFLIEIDFKSLPLDKYLVERKTRDLNNLLTSLNDKHKVFISEDNNIVWIPTIYANFNAGYLAVLEKQVKDAGFELQIGREPIKKYLLTDFCNELNKDFKAYMEIFRGLDFKKSSESHCCSPINGVVFIHTAVLESWLMIDQIQPILNHIERKIKDKGYTWCISYQGKEYTKDEYLKIKKEVREVTNDKTIGSPTIFNEPSYPTERGVGYPVQFASAMSEIYKEPTPSLEGETLSQVIKNLNKEIGLNLFSIYSGNSIQITSDNPWLEQSNFLNYVLKAKSILEKKGIRLFVKHRQTVYTVSEYFRNQLVSLKGKDGIIDIKDIDNPEGITIKVPKWTYEHLFNKDIFISQLGYKIRKFEYAGLLKSFLYSPKQFLQEYFPLVLPIPLIVASVSIVAIEKHGIPTSLSSTIIHQGVLEKIEDNKYTFKDGSSFILEKDKVSGIIPQGIEVELVHDIWGNYKFERKQCRI